MLKKFIAAFSLSAVLFSSAKADEGMWLPFLLQQLNADAMVIKGLKIPIDSIYSVNKTSLKDAVVLFGGGCTGEVISDKGLILTNHHCGYSQIQSHSSIEHDYLTDGFWAKNMGEELACPGLTVSFIIRMDDVTDQILPSLNDNMSDADRSAKVKDLAAAITKKATDGTQYTAEIKPFFYGNKYFMIVSETYKDVRMVGAPPSAVGKFGADADNWMWPRHTGDFSVFRIYADKDNNPADYSKDNVPYKPRNFFTISIKGVNEGDFTMVYGFPGKTQEYIPAAAVKTIIENTDPNRIAVRDIRLKTMDETMRVNDTVRIQYASKYASIENAYKKWKGEVLGLKRVKAVEQKKAFEKNFLMWSSENPARNGQYGSLIKKMNDVYDDNRMYSIATDYYAEAVKGIELLAFAENFAKLESLSTANPIDEKAIADEKEKMLKGSEGFFKNYAASIDKQLFATLLKTYRDKTDKALQAELSFIDTKYKGDYSKYADDVFEKSFLSSKTKVEKFLNEYTAKKVKKLSTDPAYQLFQVCSLAYVNKVNTIYTENTRMLNSLQRIYMRGQMEMAEGNKKLYPDANLTLRITYGNVEGYEPRDGIIYKYYTTLSGIIEKFDSTNYDFDVPRKLIDLYNKRDYGRYATNGKLTPCFLASNHTTGGNSGSPVINASGQLIGTNFDRVWEGTMSDIMFDPDKCRNITLDIRYTLFIIEKLGGAKWLVDEMRIVE